MSRGCVPTSPVNNLASPHVGKIVFVNGKGEIVNTSTSLKLLRRKIKKANSAGGGGGGGETENISKDSVDFINGNGKGMQAR